MDAFYTSVDPAEDAVDLEETKLFISVDEDEGDDDSLIRAFITSSISLCEKYTGRFFVQRSVTGLFSGVDVSRCELYPFIQLNRAPLVSVTSFKVMTDDAFADIDSGSYQTKDQSSYARLLITGSLTSDDVPYPLQVIFLAGYGLAKAVPEDIKTAIKEQVSFMYENRGDVQAIGKETMCIQAKSILGKYKIIDTF